MKSFWDYFILLLSIAAIINSFIQTNFFGFKKSSKEEPYPYKKKYYFVILILAVIFATKISRDLFF